MAPESALDKVIEKALNPDGSNPLPRVAAVVASGSSVLWSGAGGSRIYGPDGASEGEVTIQTPFALFSQTKLVTALCGLQMLDRGLIRLEDDVGTWIPELKHTKILSGFDDLGNEIFEEPRCKVKFYDLFLHTGGFVYTPGNPLHERFRLKHGIEKQVEGLNGDRNAITGIPLGAQPGTRVHYGTGIDYIGLVVEALTGMDLEDYSRKYLFDPIGANDIVYRRSPEYIAKQPNLVTPHHIDNRTSFLPAPFTLPTNPITCGGGGGLHSSPGSFIKILQVLLNDGVYAPTGARILQKKTVDLLFTHQIGVDRPDLQKQLDDWQQFDIDPFHKRPTDSHSPSIPSKRGWGMGSGLNLHDLKSGRRAGTLYGSGFGDTYWWVDRKAGLCATFMVNTAPARAKGIDEFWEAFETTTYQVYAPAKEA